MACRMDDERNARRASIDRLNEAAIALLEERFLSYCALQIIQSMSYVIIRLSDF